MQNILIIERPINFYIQLPYYYNTLFIIPDNITHTFSSLVGMCFKKDRIYYSKFLLFIIQMYSYKLYKNRWKKNEDVTRLVCKFRSWNIFMWRSIISIGYCVKWNSDKDKHNIVVQTRFMDVRETFAYFSSGNRGKCRVIMTLF